MHAALRHARPCKFRACSTSLRICQHPLRLRPFFSSASPSTPTDPSIPPSAAAPPASGLSKSASGKEEATTTIPSVQDGSPERQNSAQASQQKPGFPDPHGSALKRAQRRQKVDDIPTIHIPDWFLRRNVQLGLDPVLWTSEDLTECSVNYHDKSGRLIFQSFAFSCTEQELSFTLRKHGIITAAKEAVKDNPEKQSDDRELNKGKARTELGLVWRKNEYRALFQHLAAERVQFWIKAEIRAAIAASLYDQTLTSEGQQSDAIALYSPHEYGVNALNDVFESISTDLGATIISLDAQDLTDLVGDYLEPNRAVSPVNQSFRNLSYEVHRVKDDLQEASEEQTQDDDSADPEGQGEGGILPLAGLNFGGRPAKASSSRAPMFSDVFFQVIGNAAKPLNSGAFGNPANSRVGDFFVEPGSAKIQSQNSAQWDNIKLTALLDQVLEADAERISRHGDPRDSEPFKEFKKKHKAKVDSAIFDQNISEYYKLNGMFGSLASSSESICLQVSKTLSALKKANPKPAKIVRVKDFFELNATRHGSRILQKLAEVVQKRRSRGENIALVGTSCSPDFIPEKSKSGIRSVQLDNDIPFSRTILVPFSQSVERNDPLELFARTPECKPFQSDSPFFVEKRDKFRDAAINLRHIKKMLGDRIDRSIKFNDIVASLTVELCSDGGDSLFNRVLSHAEIFRIVHTAIGLFNLDRHSPQLNPVHVATAISLLNVSDEAKHRWLRGPAIHDEEEKSRATDPKPTKEDWIESIQKTANKHEKRLLGGVVNPRTIRTTFSDVHAPPQTVDALQTLTTLSLMRPEAFTYGVLATNRIPGLLLYGPPGTGKTLLAKAVARESGARMLEVSGSEVNDMYVGESEKNVRAIFSLARKLSPCVVFIDEADAIFRSRSGGGHTRSSHRDIINQFLKEWDGMNDRSVFIMVATNRPFDLDDAVLRRLPRRLLVDLPNKADREKILGIHLKDEVLASDVGLGNLATQTPLYSGSDLKNLCVAAALSAVKEETKAAQEALKDGKKRNQDNEEENASTESTYTYPERRTIAQKHFEEALKEISASISEDMASLTAMKKFDEQYGDRAFGAKKRSKKMGFGETNAGGEVTDEELESERARVRS